MSIVDGKTILITGGTGSFGSTMLRYLLTKDVKEVRILSRDEKKQEDLRVQLKDHRLSMRLGCVRDSDAVERSVDGADYVFHAAALKQVPSCEFFPIEAVKTNILGSNNVSAAALKYKVKKMVTLSTDKAVYPINGMGISKAMMEKVVLSHSLNKSNKNECEFCVTRYGNVMGSRGSVIPLFERQIAEGQPLTITNPNMTRFMMNLEESVALVMFAFEYAVDGDICVQKSPGATIAQVANAMLTLKQSSVGTTLIGTRHAEKLHEVLMSSEERVKAQDCGDYYRIPLDNRDLNYQNYVEKGDTSIVDAEPYTSENTYRIPDSELMTKLSAILIE